MRILRDPPLCPRISKWPFWFPRSDKTEGQGRDKDVPKLNASPAGGASIIMTVKLHFTKYGPSGVPNGLVEVQNEVNGKTPCLYIHKEQVRMASKAYTIFHH